MKTFLVARDYPIQIARDVRQSSTPRVALLTEENANRTSTKGILLVTTYHSKYSFVCKILQRYFNILKNDDCIKAIFSHAPLRAYRQVRNLRDPLVYGKLPPRPSTCRYLSLRQTGDLNKNSWRSYYDHKAFYALISEPYPLHSYRECSEAVCICETGCGLADRFREHRLNVLHSKGDLPAVQHFNSPVHMLEDILVAVVETDLPQKDSQQREEIRHIFRFQKLAPLGINSVDRRTRAWPHISAREVCIRLQITNSTVQIFEPGGRQ